MNYPAQHGYTPSTGPFGGDGCRVMLARYACNYSREEHDPTLPPVDLDVFGYRRNRFTQPGQPTRADHNPREEADKGARVHNHPPYRPVCAERRVGGQLRGACLNDDGTARPEPTATSEESSR